MEMKEVLELMKAFSESTIHTLKLEQEAFSIKLEKEVKINQREVLITDTKFQQEVPVSSPLQAEEKSVIEQDKGHLMISPMVGTYYHAPNPEAEAFVSVGKRVSKGQTLCIIEAMKLMNEIESDYEGEIAEILVEDGQMVEFGQPLFRIK